MKTILFLLLGVVFNIELQAQNNFQLNFNVPLSEDSVTNIQLAKSLNQFLDEAKKGSFSAAIVDSNHFFKYEFLFDEILTMYQNKGVQLQQPNVLKSYPHEADKYLITVAFSGTKDSIPIIYMVAELEAVPYNGGYRFQSPFSVNTKNFKSADFENVTYFYSGTLDSSKAQQFVEFKKQISKDCKSPNPKVDYYKFASLDELLSSYGLVYNASKCNFLCYDLGFTDDEGRIFVTGTDIENYATGYLADYLYYNVPNVADMYSAFVVAMETYYGGYGLYRVKLPELKAQFRDALKQNPKIDFLEEFKLKRRSAIQRHYSYYVMCAFLCEAAIEKAGADGMLQLLYSGRRGERFFENLNELLGINEKNFHASIVKLIND